MRSRHVLNERDYTVSQAYGFLRSKGVNTVKLDDAAIKAASRGKSQETIQQMVRAYEFIKKNEPETARPSSEKMKWQNMEKGGGKAPPWAEGLSDWNIRKEDYTDANYIRRTMWELSDHSKNPVSLWVWNGERFENHIVVLGNSKILKEMAKAMVRYARGGAEAVFAKGRGPNLLLLYNEGRYLDNPVVFKTTVGNKNLNNDWDLVANMPRKLAQITKRYESSEDDKAEDYKAWINVEKNKVHAFDASMSYYDALRRAPNVFGAAGRTVLHNRIQMERDGWCAVGINTEDEKTGAIVSALSASFALKAARMLFRLRYKNGDWNTLKIKTNDDQFTLNNRREIRDYLLSGKKPTADREVHL